MTTFILTDATAMMRFGESLGSLLQAGDVVILDGPLGAGKTTLTKGLALGLGVTDPITSPTYVISHVHQGVRTSLVHVDAYRLGSHVEFDDLDLDADLDTTVTVVEWGEGRAEGLSEEPLYVRIRPEDDGDVRQLTLAGSLDRWAAVIDALRGWS
ncbi:MAG: tRNA (adenosine(37)-N6)-threonylcarbamoyltransferase complex ATPase subunit type 1 TsaE [Actinobacteria bacterium]|nr:tRNA (adenosine(37)-N6)-threonylcarbamoyltransferase complex ATPase subunit type 1 TsaE [Actinomycetota bacterium]